MVDDAVATRFAAAAAVAAAAAGAAAALMQQQPGGGCTGQQDHHWQEPRDGDAEQHLRLHQDVQCQLMVNDKEMTVQDGWIVL
jgi:Spy/CpxP family protein refolding chaperone